MLFYSWIVCISCIGALNAKIFTVGRLTQAAVQRRYLPTFLATIAEAPNSNDEVPTASVSWKSRLLLERSDGVSM